jgi:hypothetical protein
MVTSGTRTITATDTVTSTINGTSAGITVSAAAATQLVVTASVSSVAPNTKFSVTVTAEDQFGNVATGYLGTVHFTSTDGGATLPANYKFVAGDAGVHTFTNVFKLATAGTRTITATDTVTSIAGTTGNITVT